MRIDPADITVGQRVRVVLPGVPDWKIPATEAFATVREENRDALIADLNEQIEHGGAKVYVVTES